MDISLRLAIFVEVASLLNNHGKYLREGCLDQSSSSVGIEASENALDSQKITCMNAAI